MKSAVKECLDEANKKGFRSIAFPTLGTGRLGYPSDKVASIMFPLIGQWLKDGHHRSIKEVQIIVYPKDTETLRVNAGLIIAFHFLYTCHSRPF